MTTGDRHTGAVLVVGDANADLILRGDVVPRFGQAEQLLDDATLVLGGSAAITAHGLARLGRRTALVAAIGADEFGARTLAHLRDGGVDVTAMVCRAGQQTGLTVVLAHGPDRAMLTLPATIPTLTASDVRTAIAALDGAGLTHVHVSSLYLQPGLAAELPGLLAEVRAAGLTTSLDTNADPAGRWDGVEALLLHLDVLLPNRAEVVALGADPDPRRAAARLAACGPLVVVKDGAAGAFATSAGGTAAGQVWALGGEPAEVIDTTGAGDTFDAAFLDSWLAGGGIEACLRRAVHAGSMAVAAVGGAGGQPTRRDLDTAVDRDAAAGATVGGIHDS